MKKICHVLSGFFRDDTRIFWKQCCSLASEGYDVYILTNDGLPDEIKENIKIIACETYYKKRFQTILKAKSTFLKKALEIDADIYQLHGPELIPLGLALKKYNKIIFYDAHEDLPQQILEKEWIPQIARKPLSILIEHYLKYSLSKFDELFTVTPHIVERLKKITNTVTMITNYPIVYENNFFSFEEYDKRGNILCFIGTVSSASNHENILEALSNIDNVKYHIAGTFYPESYIKNLSNIKAWSKVQFFGRLSKEDLKLFLKRVSIGIVIFDYNRNLGYKIGTLGNNKLFEYMEAGLPIICTDFDLWKEIIDKYNCGIYVQPNDIEGIKNAICYLINNKKEAYEMGQNGRKAVLLEYNWETQEKEYLKIFKKYNDHFVKN